MQIYEKDFESLFDSFYQIRDKFRLVYISLDKFVCLLFPYVWRQVFVAYHYWEGVKY